MKFRRILSLFILAVTVSCAVLPISAADYNARSYILMEASTGTVLLEENADEALPPASVTKIMTLLIIMEAIADGRLCYDDSVQVSEYAASMGGSQVYLEPGEEMSVSEMLKCVVVSSANDAAVALAEKVAGREEAFVEMMNKRAAELGMTSTVFKNTNGLDDDVEGHLTSARDIAIMSRELITKHPKILEYSSIWMDSIRGGAFGLTNTNRLIRFYRGANGLKTGSTSKAKFCISATAERDGMQLIAVVMASPTRDERNETAKKLLDYGFAGWEVAELSPKEPLSEIKLKGGAVESVALECTLQSVLLKKGQASKIRQEMYLPEYVCAPIAAGESLGRIDYVGEDGIVASVPITAAESADKISYGGVIWRVIRKMLLVDGTAMP